MDCTHHWKLASPNGDTSVGVCKHCGGVRNFSDTHAWQSHTAQARRYLATAASARSRAVNAQTARSAPPLGTGT